VTRRFDPVDPDHSATPWGRTLSLSLALHLFGFALAVGLPSLMPRPALSPVYVVDLVTLPGGPANASPPPPAPAAPAKSEAPPTPKEEKAIKVPDRTKKTPEPKKTPQPKSTPKPAATPAPTASKTSEAKAADTRTTETKAETSPTAQGTPAQGASMSGVSGGTGAMGGGFGGTGAAQADAMMFYASLVQRNIESAWKKPIYPPSETSRRAFTTQIRLVLTSSGRVSSAEIVIPSGYEALDRSVLEAVHDAMFPPFPSSLNYPSLPFPVEIVLTRD
jgi:TonB family protein